MKKPITNYTFDASEKTITFSDYVADGIDISRVLLVNNATDGILLFAVGSTSLTGSKSGAVLTLNYNTTSMSDDDDLYIVYEDDNYSLPVDPTPRQYDQDAITTYSATDGIIYGTTLLSVKTAIANVAASQTDASIIAAVTGKKIRVIACFTQAGGTATDITFNSKPAGAGVAVSPKFANNANIPNPLPRNVDGWFDTVSSEALTVTTGAGSTTGILIKYVEI